MANNSEMSELIKKMESIETGLHRAATEFLSADAVYSDRGFKMEQAVLQEVQKYCAPENNRANIIKERAAALELDIKRFLTFRADLATEVALLRMQLNLTVTSLLIEAMTWPTSSRPDTESTLEVVHHFMRDLDHVQARNVLLAAKSVLIGMKVIDASQVATNLIKIRQGKLELYLHEVLTIDVDASLDAAQDILAAEVREEAYKLIFEAAAKALGLAVETVIPIVKIATIGHELYADLQKLKKSYYRGRDDEMLDFSEQISFENQTIRKDLEFFSALRGALAQEIPA